VPRDMRWIAQYADGRIVREFEYLGPPELGRLVETPWWDLDLSRVISIGFEGSGLRVGCRLDDGVIGVNGKGLHILLLKDGNTPIAVTGGQRDLLAGPIVRAPRRAIQFKEAWSSLGMGTIGRDGRRSGIESYNVGWESAGKDELLGDWWCRLLAQIPTEDAEPVRVYFHFKASKGFSGQTVWQYGERRGTVATTLRPAVENRMAFYLS